MCLVFKISKGERAERNARWHEGEPETAGGHDADVGLSAAVREEPQDFHRGKFRADATCPRHAEASNTIFTTPRTYHDL